jgi:16S rRNA (adenine1518-N6/adenine1519-N6)-dimethyltransferase
VSRQRNSAAPTHRARKRFGQHFLHDPGVISRILAAIAPRPDDAMVEIGPGLGAITLPLLQRLDRLHAIEIDRDAIRHLREVTEHRDTLQIHEGDVLEFDLASLRTGPRLRVVGNLPYNVSTPLLFRLIEQRDQVQDMHFMLQKEVVDRMAAAPGSEHYGRLTVMLAPWLRVEPLFDIGPGAFRPPPKVVSTFVRLTPHEVAPVRIDSTRHYAVVVAAAFAQRRKTLRNALRALLSAEQIESAGVDPALRAEVIPAAGYAELAAVLSRSVVQVPDTASQDRDL